MDQPVRILIAEDDDADAELVARELRASGLNFESRRVDSERDFVRALEELDPQLVISDYRMGAFDGRRALELAQQLHPALPVIVVTGSINEETAVECIKAGAADYVIKEHLARLGPAVRSALESARLRSATVRNEERLRQLVRAVEQSPALIVTTNITGAIEYVNPEFERVTGYSASEVIGLNPRLLKSGLTPVSVYEELWSRIASGGAWHGELQNRRKDGSLFWARTRMSGVRDASGRVTHYVSVAEDVTGARRAEEALRTTEQQLLLAQKMEAIGRLAGGIAHDFNNLLSVILGHAEQLAAGLAGRSDLSARARQITWTAEKAASLTRQLLAFSRQQVLAPRVVRLDSVVSDARDMLQRVIGEDVELAVVPAPALGCVRADPGQLVQVLLNLAVNARDAMPHGGRLTVEFEDVQLDEGYVASHPPCLPGPYVMMAVTDTGHGMDAETQRRVFEPFFTTKPEGVGTGLGLSTVYGIIKQSGGFLWVYSEPGVGTSFKAYLPRVDAPEQLDEPPEPAASPASVAGPRSRILLVEDDDGVRELLADILEAEGHVVVASALPSDALRLADQHQRFDLLISDVIMPGMSGRELAHLLLERSRVARVLFVSGYAGEALARQGGLERGERFLSKPFNRRTLLDTVRQALAAAEEAPSH
jgi:two-component system, cell cycle sensor histidine kinase and response regulator CckA